MLVKELVAIDSQNPPGNEKEIAKFIYDYLTDIKIEAELVKWGENRFNTVAVLGSNKKEGIMLNGHIDTVPVGDVEQWRYDPFGQIVGDKFYGRGTSDMKGGVAAVLEAVKKLSKENFKNKLLLTFVGDEEAELGGSLYLLQKRKEIFSGINRGVIAEPTDMKVEIAQKGVVDFKITIKGKAAHGSKPELGDNAILKTMKFIDAIKKLRVQNDKVLGKGTVNIGTIVGGTKVNIVPDSCTIEIDRRLVGTETPQNIFKQYKNLMKWLGIKGHIEFMGRPCFSVKDKSFVNDLIGITKTSSKVSTGYTEAELYTNMAGINCVVLGPGDESTAHAADEFISIKDYTKSIVVFEKIIRKWCL